MFEFVWKLCFLHLGQRFGDGGEPALGESSAPSDSPVVNEVDTEGTEASEIQTEAVGDAETSESVVPTTLRNEALVLFCDLCVRAPATTGTPVEFLQAFSLRRFTAGATTVLASAFGWDNSLFFHKAFLSVSDEQ